MLYLLNTLKLKENKNLEDVLILEKDFLSEISIFENLAWIEKASIDFTLLSKVSYYKTMINLSKMNLSTLNILIPELINDFKEIQNLKWKSTKLIEAIEKLNKNKNFFIKNDEIIFSTKSEKFWYFISITKWEELRTINLTSEKNWYHIFWDWRFCSWNTYSTLKDLLIKKQDIITFITFLKKILTDYDDNKHHLASPKDFTDWKIFQNNKSNIEKMKKTFQIKEKQLINISKWIPNLSKEWTSFINQQLKEIKQNLFS